MENTKEKNQVATCKHCGKVTDIGLSKAVRSMAAKAMTMKERIRLQADTIHRIHSIKNSQIMAMHKHIAQLIELMTEEQREKAREISKSLRDEMRMIFKSQLKSEKG